MTRRKCGILAAARPYAFPACNGGKAVMVINAGQDHCKLPATNLPMCLPGAIQSQSIQELQHLIAWLLRPYLWLQFVLLRTLFTIAVEQPCTLTISHK